jgi:hypothetical protein
MSRRSQTLPFLALLCFFPTAASAELIRVTTGFLLLTGPAEVGSVSIAGSRGFSLSGEIDTSEGGTSAFLDCSGFTCQPGSSIDLQAGFPDLAFPGNRLTLEGEEFTLSGSVDSEIAMFLLFSGSFVVPPFGQPAARVVTPFAMEGFISFSPFGPRHDFTGQGLVHVSLLEGPLLGGPDRGWTIDDIRWEFEDAAPVPEPASLFLVAAGAAMMARMRSRRRNGSAPTPGSRE